MFSNESLSFFASLIERELGIVYSESNFFQLQIRLEEIIKLMNVAGIENLQKMAAQGLDSNAKQLLLDVATNNETSFFRDPRIFDVIQTAIVPAWQKANPGGCLRVWCCASSFGQEPYSLNILFREMSQATPFQWQLMASDISERALQRTKEGVFSQLEVQRGLSARRLINNFNKESDSSWRVKDIHKENFSVFKLNLLHPFSHLGLFDLILCRNVLIYQRVQHKKKIVAELLKCLKPGGILILGAGESLIGISDQFEWVSFENTVVYRPSSSKVKAA